MHAACQTYRGSLKKSFCIEFLTYFDTFVQSDCQTVRLYDPSAFTRSLWYKKAISIRKKLSTQSELVHHYGRAVCFIVILSDFCQHTVKKKNTKPGKVGNLTSKLTISKSCKLRRNEQRNDTRLKLQYSSALLISWYILLLGQTAQKQQRPRWPNPKMYLEIRRAYERLLIVILNFFGLNRQD